VSLILLTNDDGVNAPGLLALKQAMNKVGEVIVFAPDHNWSTAGHKKTLHKPLRVQETRLADNSLAFTSNGGPSDCVALAMLGVLGRLPDMVASGINPGANVAQDMTYSGTISAALEALISGIPSLAISLAISEGSSKDYVYTAHIASSVAQKLLASGRKDLLLNVNVPAVPQKEITGIEITRLGHRIYHDTLVEREDPHGHKYYWFGGGPPTDVTESGTDVTALAEKRISVTPLQLDLTAYDVLDELRHWKWSTE